MWICCPRWWICWAVCLQPLAIGFKVSAAMERASLRNHIPKRIRIAVSDVAEHSVSNPVFQIPSPLPAKFRMLMGHIPCLMGILFHIKEFLRIGKVVSVMIGSDVNPVSEPNTALTNMGTLADNQIIPTAVSTGAYFMGKTFTVVLNRIGLSYYPVALERPANKSQVEISGFGSSEKGNTKSSR